MRLIVFALPVLLLILMFNSQRKRQRSVEQIQASLQAGQQVVTTSGLFARVADLDDAVAVLEIAPGQRVRWDRRAIARVVTDGTPGWLPDDGLARPAIPPPPPETPARPADEN